MPTSLCESCQTELVPGVVSITYVGAERPLWIRLNQVPAMVCPNCRQARVEPAMARHLNELGMTVQEDLGEIRTRPAMPRKDRVDRAA